MRWVQRKLGRVPNGDRQMVEILTAILAAGPNAVETACALGAERGRLLLGGHSEHRAAGNRRLPDRRDAGGGSCLTWERDATTASGDRTVDRSQVLTAMGQIQALRE